jgi:undecaprenyl-diphosphatase
MEYWQAIIIAIIEGITEFLPVSSTGHMIIASSFMGIASNDFVKMFTIAIQFGAILSVIVLYREKFFKSFDFYFKLFIAFLPAAFFGLLLNDFIDSLLENVWVVATTLLLGGIVLLFVDKWFKTDHADTEVSYKQSLKIGFFQVIAMIPGVSRSAATIIGGLQQKLNRKQAAEFSFFLAVPTMFAATVYKMYKYQKDASFTTEEINLLIVGNVVAFIVAMIAIKAFISFLTKYGFKAFGYYRIILGLTLLALLSSGVKLDLL